MWKLGAGVYVEFLVGVAEVRFDGFGGDEQRLGDLGGGESLRGHVGDAGFGGGERVAAGEHRPSWARSGSQQFVASAVAERVRPALVSQGEALAERLTGVGSVSVASKRGAVVDQRAGVFEAGGGVLELGDRLRQQVDAMVAWLE